MYKIFGEIQVSTFNHPVLRAPLILRRGIRATAIIHYRITTFSHYRITAFFTLPHFFYLCRP